MRRITPFTLLLAACSVGGDDSPNRSMPSARLLPMASCTQAATYMRGVEIEKMNARIDASIASYDRGEGCYRGYEDGDAMGGSSGGGAGNNGGTQPPAPTTGTGTNNQVAGVDEADFIKNDGQYIYLAQNGALRIVDAWPADQTHAVSSTKLDGEPRKLFVEGNKAVVYVALGQGSGGFYGRGECTYGYDCDFSGDGTSTRLLVFDITNRAAPVLERQVDLAGSLITARRVGSAVHTVVTKANTAFQQLLEVHKNNPTNIFIP
jgi:hypothetical protein